MSQYNEAEQLPNPPAEISVASGESTPRYTNGDIAAEAGTDATIHVEGAEQLRERVEDTVKNITPVERHAEELFDQLVVDLSLDVLNLRKAEDVESRARHLESVQQSTHKLGIVLRTFLAK